MNEDSPRPNPYLPPADGMPASTPRSGKSLTTFEVLSISWASTGLFPALLIMLETRSPLGAFFGYVITIVANIPVLFSVILLLTIVRCVIEMPVPSILLSAVCGAASVLAAAITMHSLFYGWITTTNPGRAPVLVLLSIGGAVSNSLIVFWVEHRCREENHD